MWGALCVRTKQTTLISVASYSFRHYCSSYHHLVDYLVDHCCRNTTLSLHLQKHGRLLSETFLRTERSLYPTLCVCLLSPKLEFECRWTLPPRVWQVRWPTSCICGVCLSLSLYRCCVKLMNRQYFKFLVKTVKSERVQQCRVRPQFRGPAETAQGLTSILAFLWVSLLLAQNILKKPVEPASIVVQSFQLEKKKDLVSSWFVLSNDGERQWSRQL